MLRLIYFSNAQLGLNVQDLEQIMTLSVSNNAATGVTGILLFNVLNFLQILEGDEKKVDFLYARICADPRHSGLVVLQRKEISALSYPQWGMKLKEIGFEVDPNHPLKIAQTLADALITVSSEEVKSMAAAFLTLN